MRCSTLLAIFTGVLLYLVLGAVVFRALETPFEEDEHTNLLKTLNIKSLDFQFNNSCVDFEDLQKFLQGVADDLGADIDVGGNQTFSTKWDIASALFFSGTIITTIGYGNISPKSDGGKLFCIFYALVGIPMFGILLAGVGDHLGTALRKTVAKIENLFLKWRVSPTIVRVISAVLSILLGCLLFVAVPTLIFQKVEDWTLLESAYFVVITLTTVGFGDYVAGDRSHVEYGEAHKDDQLGYLWRVHMYKPLVWFWILLGDMLCKTNFCIFCAAMWVYCLCICSKCGEKLSFKKQAFPFVTSQMGKSEYVSNPFPAQHLFHERQLLLLEKQRL
uniref:Potassium two pore domain channel subfamily K member 4 n=1 Tax=Nothobranchius furzeri TaxID=105023 RepID=A0A8C6LWA1_NOTFU